MLTYFEKVGLSTASWLPVASSHTCAVLSPEPVMRRPPLGVSATLVTAPVWPLSTAISRSARRAASRLTPAGCQRGRMREYSSALA